MYKMMNANIYITRVYLVHILSVS